MKPSHGLHASKRHDVRTTKANVLALPGDFLAGAASLTAGEISTGEQLPLHCCSWIQKFVKSLGQPTRFRQRHWVFHEEDEGASGLRCHCGPRLCILGKVVSQGAPILRPPVRSLVTTQPRKQAHSCTANSTAAYIGYFRTRFLPSSFTLTLLRYHTSSHHAASTRPALPPTPRFFLSRRRSAPLSR